MRQSQLPVVLWQGVGRPRDPIAGQLKARVVLVESERQDGQVDAPGLFLEFLFTDRLGCLCWSEWGPGVTDKERSEAMRCALGEIGAALTGRSYQLDRCPIVLEAFQAIATDQEQRDVAARRVAPVLSRELNFDERATWGTCPVCDATHGQACDSDRGIPCGVSADGGRIREGAHLGRLNSAPARIRIEGCA